MQKGWKPRPRDSSPLLVITSLVKDDQVAKVRVLRTSVLDKALPKGGVMPLPCYVGSRWIAGRLGITTYVLKTLVEKKEIPAPDIKGQRSKLWRLSALLARCPGLIDNDTTATENTTN